MEPSHRVVLGNTERGRGDGKRIRKHGGARVEIYDEPTEEN
jgi:hypothetical protein